MEYQLKVQKPNPVSWSSSVYTKGEPVNKKPFFTLGCCLALGTFWGLLFTGAMWFEPEIRRRLKVYE